MILVVGATGQLGSLITRRLLEQGKEVRILVREGSEYRALDGVAATIDALPRVADRVARRIPVLMDGGIRRGGDVLKALARGASAVLIGRPYLYGLAVNGSDGVQHIVEILRRELETAMALTGRTTVGRIDHTVLWPDKP